MSAVLNAPPPAKFTPDDLLRLPDEGKGFELVDGELKEMNLSFLSSYVAGKVFAAINTHVTENKLGWTSPEGTSFRCFPDDDGQVRRADSAFHALNRLTARQATTEGHCTVVPDLVVEVVSPNDLANEVNEKRIEWLVAGVRLVWIIHPIQQTVHAYKADGTVRDFRRSDILTGDPVLPELRILVAELFKLPTEAN